MEYIYLGGYDALRRTTEVYPILSDKEIVKYIREKFKDKTCFFITANGGNKDTLEWLIKTYKKSSETAKVETVFAAEKVYNLRYYHGPGGKLGVFVYNFKD